MAPIDTAPLDVPPGLKGVVVAETALGDVRGEEGFYHYRQHAAPELARRRSLEDVWHLLLDGELPDAARRRDFAEQLAPLRHPAPAVLRALPAIAADSGSLAVALRTALSHHAAVLDLPPMLDCSAEQRRHQALAVSAAVPAIVAALHRLRLGLDPVSPRTDLPLAADYLRMVHGTEADPDHVRAIEQYLVLGLDHGFNASTFTARVVTSTGSDLGSAVVAALGALLGPLHGGAPSRSLDTLDAIGDPANAAGWVRATVAAGGRIMGFGHAVYRTEDPRCVLLREIAEGLGGELVAQAVAVEAEVERTLAELKPGRRLKANVEWYAAVVMAGCGLDRSLFTPTFAASRVIGWCAHALEQAADGRLIRPSSRYVGPPAPQPVPPA
ncbi:MAG TPA: citrate/2-methylcitrate synthase [Acidimicrobiales bacterium]|nr:citrate/2-methylcitrate synthase [Acidimicrobiales bacterium]